MRGLRGRLPGVEPRPYIIRFVEDKPNPLYRRICYTFAWSIVVTFAILNLAGLGVAVATGVWRLKQIYLYGYFPIAAAIWALGAFGILPRVRASTKGEGHERRYFYGAVWASCIAQPVLGVLWKTLPHTREADSAEAHYLRRNLRRDGDVGLSRSSSTHPAHRAGRVGDFRLRRRGHAQERQDALKLRVAVRGEDTGVPPIASLLQCHETGPKRS